MDIKVYTDGSCDNLTGIGSYGYVITAKVDGLQRMRQHSSKKYVDTTNNRMELKAIIASLENIKPGHRIEIFSDSQYCIRSINEWLNNWVRYNKLQDKANAELWLRFLRASNSHLTQGSVLVYSWVRGHNGTELNEVADKLASVGRLTQGGGINCKEKN